MESEEREKIGEGRRDSRLSRIEIINNQEGNADVAMDAVSAPDRPRSWKDRLMGTGLRGDEKAEPSSKEEDDDDLDILDGDIVRSLVNGIPAFFDRINQILIKDMEHTVVIKLLGGIIGRVAKLDFNTDNGVRGRFARMAVYVNLGKALISHVFINGLLQKVNKEHELIQEVRPDSGGSNGADKSDAYGPLMIVERRNRRWSKGKSNTNSAVREKGLGSSQFQALKTLNDEPNLHDNGSMRRIHETQKESRSAEKSLVTPNGAPPIGQIRKRPGKEIISSLGVHNQNYFQIKESKAPIKENQNKYNPGDHSQSDPLQNKNNTKKGAEVDGAIREDINFTNASQTQHLEENSVMSRTEGQITNTVQCEGKIHVTQSVATLGSQQSQSSTTDRMLEVTVTPTIGALDPSKHSIVTLKKMVLWGKFKEGNSQIK
ncbi:hypothetical protein GOBAR_AA03207 [Gossypium barbadense]|uniref:DUF4283 domain-containing protein n=1 Tax=Gossypium barbadense TaxID=3634 RepID=A0A2P5YPB6_GOSBA|nr:hypothetical protein GOBAR_AA03207 [Gossypium barbadense]